MPKVVRYSIGDVLETLRKFIFNPVVCFSAVIIVHVERFGFLQETSTPIIISSALVRLCTVVCFISSLLYYINSFSSTRTLNNNTKDHYQWAKEVILVTGGAGGIGGFAARRFASKGSQVVVLDVLPLTYPKPENLHFFQVDIADLDAIQSIAKIIKNKIGEPSCVIANAGICRGKRLLESSRRDVEVTFSVNTLGLVWTMKTFVPSMIRRNHGHFLVLASQTAYIATAGVSDYCASKAAAYALYEGLHSELRHTPNAQGVRVSAICPSAVDTKMFDGITAPDNFFLPRLQPQDVADAVCETVWSGQAKNLLLPAFAYAAPFARVVPDWMRVFAQDVASKMADNLSPHRPIE